MPRVLLLETDNLLAKNVSKALRAKGLEVDWQVEPQAAVTAVDERPVDLVIMDLVLANRSGIEFLYEFRSYPDWQNLPVIIYTSVPPGQLADCADSLGQLGVSAYLYKPATTLAGLSFSVLDCLAATAV
ncbi:MAG TPA: response regulator [Candidatus Saccharimonadales bacterium]|nr:response regulator [Candidatus Saccharimonadales bacterium]